MKYFVNAAHVSSVYELWFTLNRLQLSGSKWHNNDDIRYYCRKYGKRP